MSVIFQSEQKELQFYRKLFNNTNAAIYTINLDPYRIEWINDSKILKEILGLNREEILSQSEFIAAKLLANPDYNESVLLATEKFKEDPNISWAGVYRIKDTDENLNWVIYATSTLEIDKNGTPTKVVCVAIDPKNILNTPKTLDEFIKYICLVRHRSQREKLTKRQNEILTLILENKSTEAIATVLSISKYTVMDHKKLLYKKLGCTNSNQLFAKAQLMGFL